MSVATTRLRPGALIVVIQTRWHRDDLTGRILEQAAQTKQPWRVVKFPALAEQQDVLGRQPGEALWPEVYTQERLEQVRANNSNYYWSAMYQQNPQAEGSAEWPDKFFSPDIWFNEWPQHYFCRVIALDPSKGSESKFGDYSALVMIQVSEDGIYTDALLMKCNTSELVETAIELQRQFGADWFGVETNQFQQLLATEINRVASTKRMLMPTYMLTNTVNKLVRIRRLTPYLANKQLKFRGNSHGSRLLVEQLRDFPNGDHDDGPDALEMAVRLADEMLAQVEWNEQQPQYVRV